MLPVILDVDPGIDDALALIMATRLPELELVGVTTVAGNVEVLQATANALAVLALSRRGDVEVHSGATGPLAGRLTTASFFHGQDGLGGTALTAPPGIHAHPLPAHRYLGQAAREKPGQITVIALAPLTNLAQAMLHDPAFPHNVKAIVIMGGASTGRGNVTPAAEANFYNDPEAARLVLSSGADITLVDLDVCEQALLTPDRLRGWREKCEASRDLAGSFCLYAQENYMAASLRFGAAGCALHDPLAVALTARPELGQRERVRAEVETAGSITRGALVASPAMFTQRLQRMNGYDDVTELDPVEPNAWLYRRVDGEAFLALFERLLGLANA